MDVDEAVAFLNSALAIDRVAMTALMVTRFPCNEALANHETIQVMAVEKTYLVGGLGLLNGLFGIREDGMGHGMGHILIEISEDGLIQRFGRTQ